MVPRPGEADVTVADHQLKELEEGGGVAGQGLDLALGHVPDQVVSDQEGHDAPKVFNSHGVLGVLGCDYGCSSNSQRLSMTSRLFFLFFRLNGLLPGEGARG